jgi:prophage maintenance system killer protein
MAERVYLTVAEVVAIHHHQIEEYGGIHGLRDQGALEAAVFRPQTGYYKRPQRRGGGAIRITLK